MKYIWASAENIFARIFFPLSMFIALPTYFYLVSQGHTPEFSLFVCELPIVFLIIIFERIYPNRASWNKSCGDVLTDMAHNIVYYFTFILAPLLAVPIVSFGYWLFDRSFLPIESLFWPTSWPLFVQLVLALVLGEGLTYCLHRAQHKIPILWRFHSIHHSPRRLYWLNTGRFHVVNALIDILPIFVFLLAFGIPKEVFVALLLFTAINGFFQHSNLKIHIGFLNWIFSNAELHRWHHSNVEVESNHNYGQNIILWDIIFGTRFLPEKKEQPESIGISYPEKFPTKFIQQLLAPFRWKKIENDS